MSLTAEAVTDLVTRIARALTVQMKEELQNSISELSNQFTAYSQPIVEEYKDIAINDRVQCDIGLDVVKTVPEFSGFSEKYPSWRQSSIAAIKPFEKYNGSNRYYQAVAILRNKIVGDADTVLTSFDTPLNFEAILTRLDHTCCDKRTKNQA